MKHDDLRAAIRREPFLAFNVQTMAGRTYPVVHPENIALSPRVEVVLLKHGDGRTAMIDVEAITEVTYPVEKPEKGSS